jgi:GT2 family glycosyltransferase
MSFGVVILNKYVEVILPLLESIRCFIPPHPRIVIVADGHSDGYGYETVYYRSENFCFAAAANLGIRALGTEDVILLNDDCVILEENFFSRLHIFGSTFPEVGILSPLVVGCVGNPLQRWHEADKYWHIGAEPIKFTNDTVCFVCAWLSRRMLNDIGLLNENIKRRYGYEDDEMCRRARAAGWQTAVTSTMMVQHGDGGTELGSGWGKSWSTSFARRYPRA